MTATALAPSSVHSAQGQQYGRPEHAQGPKNPTGMVGLAGSRETERLQFQSTTLELSISDSSGRDVHVSLNMEQLDYSRTYDKFGMVGSAKGKHGLGPMVQQMRDMTGKEIGDQIRDMAKSRGIEPEGMAYFEHQEELLHYESMSLSVEGDMSLLNDFFNAENTAQRIFDFAKGLGDHIDSSTPEYGNFMDDITRGIESGFDMAESMLGQLAEVSHKTHDLLNLMLTALQDDPSSHPQAVDYLDAVEDAKAIEAEEE